MNVNTKVVRKNTTKDKYFCRIFLMSKEGSISLGDFVRKVRNDKGLSVADVSRRSNGKISTSYISKLENEPNVKISYPKIEALAQGLGVTESEITAIVKGEKIDSGKVIDERFENMALRFRGLEGEEKERANALIDLMEREIERLAAEKR